MCQNRIMFKQFITEGAIDIVQIDSCRMGGLNEVLAVLLLRQNTASRSGRMRVASGFANMCSISHDRFHCCVGTKEGG